MQINQLQEQSFVIGVCMLDTALLEHYQQSLGIEVIKKMLALYEQQSAEYIADIKVQLAAKSKDGWGKACHKMKGAAGSVGLQATHKHLASIEKSDAQWPEKENYFTELLSLNESGIAEFKHWIENTK